MLRAFRKASELNEKVLVDEATQEEVAFEIDNDLVDAEGGGGGDNSDATGAGGGTGPGKLKKTPSVQAFALHVRQMQVAATVS